MPCDILSVNDTKYTVLRLLGKGKGGYSYLVKDGRAQYVLKQIHHEPCELLYLRRQAAVGAARL